MYGVAGEKATGRIKIGRFFTNFADPNYSHATRSYIFRRGRDWLWNYIGFRPRLSDSLIDKISTLS
jgi:hypothetical protein